MKIGVTSLSNLAGTKTVTINNLISGLNIASWGTFNGTYSPILILSSYNMSAITDNGVGDYTISFISGMYDTNYGIVAMSKGSDASDFSAENVIESYNTTRTREYVRICNSYNGTAVDTPLMNVVVFR